MKRILGIIASPRKLGNCEIMVKEVGRQITTPHELRLLRLSEFNLLPCRGCYACLFKEEKCIQNDDFQQVLDAILEADALIVAAPTYFLGANATLKRLLDRGLAFYAHIDRLWGKPAVGIAIAGIAGKEGHALLGVQNFLKMSLTDIKQTRICYGALPGEVFLNGPNRAAAADLAAALFAPAPRKTGPVCPLCGGDTFRFLGKDRVHCQLCSNPGILRLEADGPVFDIQKSGHELFLSKEEALHHKEWLLQMKARYLDQKEKLKEITLAYRKPEDWIRPAEVQVSGAGDQKKTEGERLEV
ncbi:MAG: flavodoxin family protein [Thermodesulfobacteriota bacterium]